MGNKFTRILPTEESSGSPALYLGSIDYLVQDEILSDLDIKSIVSALPSKPAQIPEVLEKHSIANSDYRLYPLEDTGDMFISLFEDPNIHCVVEFIHVKLCLERKNVLVHCDSGITRSPAVVIAYLMTYGLDVDSPTTLSFKEAITHVRQLRERVDVCLFSEDLRKLDSLLADGYHEVHCRRCPCLTCNRQPRSLAFPISESNGSLESCSLEDLAGTSLPTPQLAGCPHAPKAIKARSPGRAENRQRLQLAWAAHEGKHDDQTACNAQLACAFQSAFCQIGGERVASMLANARVHDNMPAVIRQLLYASHRSADLKKLALVHLHLGLTDTDFEQCEAVWMETLRSHLAEEWTQQHQEDWHAFFHAICLAMRIQLRRLRGIRPPPLTCPMSVEVVENDDDALLGSPPADISQASSPAHFVGTSSSPLEWKPTPQSAVGQPVPWPVSPLLESETHFMEQDQT
eukprot:TRINITY_DN8242_c0_g1_i1.p1 TRINITY_DN8242_c0_g1~~TRINITY_DN8242_c0_g1_i1.p1  ORF type:complete len:460 (-),score=54.75 TRINITY_DN8242_c0_g1_i1:247-1626(-)